MKQRKIVLCAAIGLFSVVAFAQKPAFPGAEGFGRYTKGGRGGKVVYVTNLNDSGPGSLREAVKGDTPKIVVFNVSGIIALNSNLNIGANTTIMGQTAPGPGVTVRYYTTGIDSNVIVRYVRFRRGEERNVNDGADAAWTRQKTGIILDHCSFSWSIDEVASFYDNRDFTMQWCTVGESLNNPGHSKGAHGYGGIWGGKNASFHHNLLIGHTNRSPRFNGARYSWEGYDKTKYENTVMAERVDFRNCVNYNWGTGGCYGGPGGGFVNMVNNYYKAGPATSNKTRLTQVSINSSSVGDSKHPELYGLTSRYYIDGNYMAAASNPQNYDWSGVIYDSGVTGTGSDRTCIDANNFYGMGAGAEVPIKLTEPINPGDVTTHSAEVAYEKVLTYAGASLEKDMVDVRYEQETREGTAFYCGSVTNKPGILDFVADQGGYSVSNKSWPNNYDTDKDGIPDNWELENDLDPNDASDASLYTLDPAKYYTNVEIFCNSIVQKLIIDQLADGDDAVADYYPAYRTELGETVEAINMPELGGTIPSDGVVGTLTWGLHNGMLDATATVSASIEDYISTTDATLGTNWSVSGKRTASGIDFLKIDCKKAVSGAEIGNALTFTFTPMDGCKFKPTEVGYKIARVGTNGGVFDLGWQAGDQNIMLASGVDFMRDSEYTDYKNTELESIFAEEGESNLIIYVYNQAVGKAYEICDVYVKGVIITSTAGIESIEDLHTQTVTYYDMQGMKLNARPESGTYITVRRGEDGRNISNKVSISRK